MLGKSLILTENEIVCPISNGKPLIIELKKVAVREARLAEVQFVKPGTAPELLAEYNEGFLEINDYLGVLRSELINSESELGRIRSKIILDEIPKILKERGLSSPRSPLGSEDLRNAILDGNDEYVEVRDRCHQIECVIELLKGKQKAFENAFTSIKKIMGEDAYMRERSNRGVSAGEITAEPGMQSTSRYFGHGKI